MHHRMLITLAAAWAVSCSGAGAQVVYRCGSSYSQQPCEGGMVVDTGDTGNAAHAPPGKEAAADLQRAEAMEKARLAQEKNAPKALIIGGDQSPLREALAKDGARAKAGKLEQFTAVSPGTKPAKKKKKKKAS